MLDDKKTLPLRGQINLLQAESQTWPTRSMQSEQTMRRRSQVALLTGAADKPYALGLAAALIEKGISFDFIGSDDISSPFLREDAGVNFLNLRGDQSPDANVVTKTFRVLAYYFRLLRYAATAQPRVFHILWNNKLEWFDRTVLLIYYRLLGKKIVFTAHNVNAAERDGHDGFLNRLTLRMQYHLNHHIFVHSQQAKQELAKAFTVSEKKISVIPFGINNTVPNTALTPGDAKIRLGLSSKDKAILFFGNIAPYKGLEYLVQAMSQLARTEADAVLFIVGRPKNCAQYWGNLSQEIKQLGSSIKIIQRIEFVPDEETELYFKAADVLVLPYTHVFQSGVLSLGYSFGLPVIATDVGSLAEDILPGETGFVCRPLDPADLAAKLRAYFDSDLYRELESRRRRIQDQANRSYSWERVAETTTGIYQVLDQSIKKTS